MTSSDPLGSENLQSHFGACYMSFHSFFYAEVIALIRFEFRVILDVIWRSNAIFCFEKKM